MIKIAQKLYYRKKKTYVAMRTTDVHYCHNGHQDVLSPTIGKFSLHTEYDDTRNKALKSCCIPKCEGSHYMVQSIKGYTTSPLYVITR